MEKSHDYHDYTDADRIFAIYALSEYTLINDNVPCVRDMVEFIHKITGWDSLRIKNAINDCERIGWIIGDTNEI